MPQPVLRQVIHTCQHSFEHHNTYMILGFFCYKELETCLNLKAILAFSTGRSKFPYPQYFIMWHKTDIGPSGYTVIYNLKGLCSLQTTKSKLSLNMTASSASICKHYDAHYGSVRQFA